MGLNEIDPFYIKAITALHSKDHLRTGDVSPLQKMVEEAIKAKSGKDKDLSGYVTACIKLQTIDEFKNLATIEDSKTASSSDNELELDLLKEDLMCVICNGMDVGARNRLLECSDCHSLYHQECHRPPVSQQDADNTWVCQNCKDSKKIRASSPSSLRSSPVQGSKSSKSSSHRSSGGNSSSSYKSSSSSKSVSSKPNSSSSGSLSKSSSGKPAPASTTPPSSSTSQISSSGSSSRNIVTPNINIISADKRIQSMKKKAAKLQEKRKLPR
ncbi:nuclear factor-related [Holotrichia oblita]|uniref:Nuclear factor-related n=1 Tax=Holotrichia oblita TaxID=644536 RepID=A0ACB9T623_HOLOL|nr:nuclear factor-related [Holotrichia oblita]